MDAVQLFQLHVDSLNDRTFQEKAAEFFQQDLEYLTSARPGTLGLGDFIIGTADILDALPDLTATVTDHEVSGDNARFTMLMQGTFTGEMKTADGGSIPGTGNHATWQSTIDVVFRDGKIARWVTHVDGQEFRRQLGIG